MGTTKRQTAARRRPARREPAADRTRAEFLLWWANVGGMLDELYAHVERLREHTARADSPLREMFGYGDLRQLAVDLSEAACQWGACAPRLFPRTPDPLERLLRATNGGAEPCPPPTWSSSPTPTATGSRTS